MATRAVSAGKSWLTPLAILFPIAATPLAAFWALTVDPVTTGPMFAGLVLIAGLTATGFAGRLTYGYARSVITAIVTWVAGILALPVWYVLSFNSSFCGKNVDDSWAWLPVTGGALVFFALGCFGFRSDRGVWVTPIAFLLGVLATTLLYVVVPGTQGVCET
jgi:hypothetical protein